METYEIGLTGLLFSGSYKLLFKAEADILNG
jgi:hypothetical protein